MFQNDAHSLYVLWAYLWVAIISYFQDLIFFIIKFLVNSTFKKKIIYFS
jgi:hypothetical protein